MRTGTGTLATATHPLAAKGFSEIGTWSEWEKGWQETSDPRQLLGLLQFGFDIPMDQWDKRGREEMDRRLCFYLELADGHGNDENFGPPSGRESFESPLCRMSERQLKRVISQKAFEVLCLRFFKNTHTGPGQDFPSWAPQVICPAVFGKILWFFRPSEGTVWLGKRIHNLDGIAHMSEKDHHLTLACEFAFGLCKFAFEFRCLGRSSDEMDIAARKMFDSARGDLTILLLGLDKERFLLSTSTRFEVGNSEMKALELAAFSEEFWDGEHHRKCQTIEEAFALGSRAAEILILLRIRKQQLNRLQEIRDMKKTVVDANRKIERLEGSPVT